MNPAENLSPEEQKEALRLRLQAQRKRLVRQLTPTDESSHHHHAYPRSMTMRFLTRGQGAQWMATAAASLFGKNASKTLTTALVVSKAVSTMLAGQRNRRTRAAAIDELSALFTSTIFTDKSAPKDVTVTLERPPSETRKP
ncbi:hypothetical protein [Cellvibrio polysaccharolyticus]|uniref:Uncharacterized protein n=1 Tax=Cellvibrio polysaccharolyticus TaxID=2082724 RepID=A0A928V2C4_9GAMM|nr:hypothetical protein [Cellvibrio polysaccharolyticus]MBE8716523.1 hypothetical protein [Cellvibrio polysaccharolyticus]